MRAPIVLLIATTVLGPAMPAAAQSHSRQSKPKSAFELAHGDKAKNQRLVCLGEPDSSRAKNEASLK